jgi:uncharacterized membrane protein
MLTGLQHLHSALRWVVLLLLVITIADNLMRAYRSFNQADNKLALFTLISMHLQLLIGLVLWGVNLTDALSENEHIMKDKYNRFFLVEHFLLMVVAVALVTVGYVRQKRQEDKSVRHRMIFGYYLAAFVVVMVSIPWPFRDVIGKGWF